MTAMTPDADDRPDRRTFLLGAGAMLLTACAGSEAASDADPAATAEPSATATAVPATDAAVEPTAEPVPAEDPASSEDVAPVEEPAPAVEEDAVAEVRVLAAADFDALGVCVLLPESTTGPYPSKSDLERTEIHEGYPGHPLRLGIRVVDQSCTPIPGALVDIWHTDATGDYSSYDDNGSGKDEGDGSTFCRGVQFTDGEGIAEFTTIYPGWYEGRAVHIHVTVEIDGEHVRTGQMYLDEAYSDAVYTTGVYAEFGSPDTSWADDRIAGDPVAEGSAMSVAAGETVIGPGSLALINVGVNP